MWNIHHVKSNLAILAKKKQSQTTLTLCCINVCYPELNYWSRLWPSIILQCYNMMRWNIHAACNTRYQIIKTTKMHIIHLTMTWKLHKATYPCSLTPRWTVAHHDHSCTANCIQDYSWNYVLSVPQLSWGKSEIDSSWRNSQLIEKEWNRATYRSSNSNN
jgi:hypothetical protein